MSVLDLKRSIELTEEALEVLDALDQSELDERPGSRDEAIFGLSKAESRDLRLKNSRDLQRAAHKLTLAAELIREQHWNARTNGD